MKIASKSKKKLIWMISSLCAVIVFVGVTLGVVLAATQQTVNTSISITYRAINIEGTVSAKYTVGTETKDFETPTGEKVVAFYADDEDLKADLSMVDDVVLNSTDKRSIVMEYTFTNTGDAMYTAVMSFKEEGYVNKNVKIEYSKDNTTYRENGYVLFVEGGAEVKYYIRVGIDDLAKNSALVAGIEWKLEYLEVESEEEQASLTAMDYTSIDNGQTYTANYIGGELIDGTLVVPTKIARTPITMVNGSLADETAKSNLTKLVVPEGIESVTGFENYPNLEIVRIGSESTEPTTFAKSVSSVTPSINIAENAFKGCSELTEIYIGSEVKGIGKNAFNGCTKLESVTFEENSTVDRIGEYSFYNCKKLANGK